MRLYLYTAINENVLELLQDGVRFSEFTLFWFWRWGNGKDSGYFWWENVFTEDLFTCSLLDYGSLQISSASWHASWVDVVTTEYLAAVWIFEITKVFLFSWICGVNWTYRKAFQTKNSFCPWFHCFSFSCASISTERWRSVVKSCPEELIWDSLEEEPY